ncbi:coiled-coil domain-containing protein 121 [Dipodomys spectabilis]|uniref:coiled-coil domain-containing protein 121 n=1 Tax=Dipodomys spectabilis TaxID=105255 RepID=UPI001C5407F5|nr:coiled-coil domain-containing protein 121 [Dipodomys spectabilis]
MESWGRSCHPGAADSRGPLQAKNRNEPQRCPKGPDACKFAQKSSSSPSESPYLTVLNEYFNTTTLTMLENRVKTRTVTALKVLNIYIQEARIRRKKLVQESRLLQEEPFQEERESKCLLTYLNKTNGHFRRKHEELWEDYVQQLEAIGQRRQELASRFATQTADLQAQLFQRKKILYDLKQQLLAMRDISQLKKTQEMTLLELQKKIKKVESETTIKDQEAHFQFLKQKTLLEKQLSDLDKLQKGETKTRELKRKAKAWELIVQQGHRDVSLGFRKENQQQLERLYQLCQEFKQLEDTRRQLNRQRQHRKEERWYQEGLTRGWQRLQARHKYYFNHSGCPKEQVHQNLS